MKKALIVTRVSGFVPQFEMNNVKLLQQMGYEVHYASNFDTVVYGNDNNRLKDTGIVCHHIPFCRSPFSPKIYSSYRALKHLMLSEAFDLIHCHMPMTGVVTRVAAQVVRRKTKRSIPVLYTTHGFHFYGGGPLKNWIYYVPERWLARYTDWLITVNEEDYQRALGFAVRGQVEKIPGIGIQIEDTVSGRNAKEENDRFVREKVRHKLGMDESDYMLLSVGELNANKNHIQVLRALLQCQDKTLKYVLCGQGPLREKLEHFVKVHGLEKQVCFMGYCTEVDAMLRAADCFVFPSLREGLSVALMEAMRAGLPVVAKKIRGNTDLILPEQGGLLLESGSTEEYVKAIRFLKHNREKAAQMGRQNKDRIRYFSIDRVEKKMQRIYSEALQER